MYTHSRNSKADTTLPLSARRHAIAYGLLLLPVSVIIAIAATLTSQPQVPPVLLALLIMLGLSQAALAQLALQHLFSAELIMDNDGLTINRFLNSEKFAWRDIASVDVTPATGTLLDNPFCAIEQRVGVGLTMRDSVVSSKGTSTPDVIIAACDASHTIRMMQLAERIQQFRVGLSSTGIQRQTPKARQANQKNQFTSRQATSTA